MKKIKNKQPDANLAVHIYLRGFWFAYGNVLIILLKVNFTG